MRKILDLLTPGERRGAAGLLGLMLVGMVLETLGVGLVVPAIALLTREDFARSYPALEPALHALGQPDRQALIVGGLLALVAVYVVKALLPALHQATVFSRKALTTRPYDTSFAIAGDYDAMAAIASSNVRYEMLDVAIAEFELGGTSFRHPVRLMMESDRIRRDVLKLHWAKRLLATSANAFSNIALWAIWRGTGWWLSLRATLKPGRS